MGMPLGQLVAALAGAWDVTWSVAGLFGHWNSYMTLLRNSCIRSMWRGCGVASFAPRWDEIEKVCSDSAVSEWRGTKKNFWSKLGWGKVVAMDTGHVSNSLDWCVEREKWND